MAVTIYRGVMKLSPPTWRHHRLMIASTIVPIIQWQMSLIAGVDRSGKANLRRDVSLLRRTLRSLKTAAKRGRGRVESDSAGLSFESSVKNAASCQFELGR